jgi:ribonuclease R
MRDKVGEDFDGIILGVAPFGLFVQLVDHFIDGLVHVSSMNDDYYRFVEGEHLLFGEATRRRYKLGDKVRVQVVKVDRERRQIELALTEILEAAGGRRRGASTASRAVKSGCRRSVSGGRYAFAASGKHERAMKKRGGDGAVVMGRPDTSTTANHARAG